MEEREQRKEGKGSVEDTLKCVDTRKQASSLSPVHLSK